MKGFKTKLLLVQFVAVIPLLIFIFYILDLWYDTSRSAVVENTITQARLVASTIHHAFTKDINLTNGLASSTTTKDDLKTDLPSLQNTIRSITANNPDISAIDIADPLGKTILFSQDITKTQKESISIGDREYFQTALVTKKPAISDPLKGRFRGTDQIVVAAPILEGGDIKAVIATAVDLELIKKDLENTLPADDKSIVMIYDKNNRLAFTLHKPLPTDEEKISFNNLSFLTKKKEGHNIIIENQKLPNSDEQYLGTSVEIERFGWKVVYLVPTDKIFAPVYKVQATTWLILLAALLFALSLISYCLRKIKMIY